MIYLARIRKYVYVISADSEKKIQMKSILNAIWEHILQSLQNLYSRHTLKLAA